MWNRLSGENLTYLMRNTIEGPDLNEVNFNEILDMSLGGGKDQRFGGGGGEIPAPPLYETLIVYARYLLSVTHVKWLLLMANLPERPGSGSSDYTGTFFIYFLSSAEQRAEHAGFLK